MLLPDNVTLREREIPGGAPVFRGTRVPFHSLLDYLEGGQTTDEFLDEFASLSREAAGHVPEHAKALLVGEPGSFATSAFPADSKTAWHLRSADVCLQRVGQE